MYVRLNTDLFFGFVKLTGYLTPAVNVLSSNHYVSPSPKINISLFLLSKCTDELILAPKKIILLFIFPSGNGNSEHESNLIYFSIREVLVAKLVISAISPLTSFILALREALLAELVTSIFYFQQFWF